MINLISRERVLALLIDHGVLPELYNQVARLPYFPAPNPNMKGDQNILGQTEDEFWEIADTWNSFLGQR